MTTLDPSKQDTALPPGVSAVVECPSEPWHAPLGSVELNPGQPTWQPEAESLVPGFSIECAATDSHHRVVALGGGRRLQIFDRDRGALETEFLLARDIDEVAVAPDGSAVAFSVGEIGLALWERGKGFVSLERAALEYVSAFAFAGDGQRLVVVDSDQRVGVWARATGGCLWLAELGPGLWPYRVLTDSSWDRALVAAEVMLDGVQLWSIPLDGSAPEERSAVSRIDRDASRSTLFVAAGTDDDGLPLYEFVRAPTHAVAQDCERRARIEAQRDRAGQLTLVRTLAESGSVDEVPLGGSGELRGNPVGFGLAPSGEIFYADEQRACLFTATPHSPASVDPVECLLLDPTRKRLWRASSSGVGFQTLGGEARGEWHEAACQGPAQSLSLGPDGRVLCLGDGELFSATDPGFAPLVPGAVRALSEDGAWVACALGGMLEVGPLGESRAKLPMEVLFPRQGSVRFLPGGHELLGVGPGGCWRWREGGASAWVQVSSVAALSVLAFSPVEARAALATGEGLWLLSLDASEPARSLGLPAAVAAEFLADGRLAVATLDRWLHLYDARVGLVVSSWRCGAEPATCLAGDEDGATLFSGGSDGAVVAWDLERLAPRP